MENMMHVLVPKQQLLEMKLLCLGSRWKRKPPSSNKSKAVGHRQRWGREFGVLKQTVLDFMKNKRKTLEVAAKSTGAGKKNVSQGVYQKLEETLLVWLNAMISKKIPVSGDIMKQKVEVFALRMNVKDFKFSDGWLPNFKNRNDFKL
ncbi:hypothetical protein HPB50_013897 [Hyalomma asiaticum]|uniref:Uncharacterized protein n=1 Tax=Hyalomma asiaticum TaxID=266040 RepID=A0ACB7TIB5_HYAAI|nr:hypothetical protein HPB50_013897 [Hyalomma asiaticum]